MRVEHIERSDLCSNKTYNIESIKLHVDISNFTDSIIINYLEYIIHTNNLLNLICIRRQYDQVFNRNSITFMLGNSKCFKLLVTGSIHCFYIVKS